MCYCYGGHILFPGNLPKTLLSYGSSGCHGTVRGTTGTLNTCIHVCLIVQTHIGKVVAPLKGTRYPAKTYITCCTIPSNCHYVYVSFWYFTLSSQYIKSRFHPRGNGCSVFKGNVNPWHFPGTQRIWSSNDLHTTCSHTDNDILS